jgi:hypothetical protein
MRVDQAQTGSPLEREVRECLEAFAAKTGLHSLSFEVHERNDASILVLYVASPSERHYRAANEIASGLSPDHPFSGRIVVRQRHSGRTALADPEARLLQRTLASAVTSDRHSFRGEFFDLYIPTVSRAEEQVLSEGNHIVFGRRGAGKSSLLVYALRRLEEARLPSAWVDMQTYEHRGDTGAVVDLLLEILGQLAPLTEVKSQVDLLGQKLRALQATEGPPSVDAVRRCAPDLKRLFAAITTRHRFTIFLDDLHVVSESLQPLLLGVLYSFARGNKVSLKVSALEHFTRHWDPQSRLGLEVPGDAQTISLDHNLTNPANALEHIRNILNSYARFCGLKSIQSVCGKDVIERLVWLAAGVPRDALSILQQAMASAAADGRRIAGVTDVNIAASGYVEDKNRYLGMDTSEGQERVKALLEAIKEFCIKQKRVNAFLVRLGNEEGAFKDILRLIDLRFLHVLNRGLTPGEAGERYIALLLDYGFYTGVRRAKTMDVLQQKPGKLTYRELRKLPKFDPMAALAVAHLELGAAH